MIGRREAFRRWVLARIESRTLPHAILLTGPSGIGKGEAALWAARATVCEGDPRPCGVCEPCRSFQAYSDLDLRLLRPVDRPVWVERERLEELFPDGILPALERLQEGGFLLPPLPNPAGRTLVPLRVNPTVLFRRGRGSSPRLDRSALQKRLEEIPVGDGEGELLREILHSSFSLEWYLTTIGIGHLTGGSSARGGEISLLSFIGRKPAGRRRKVVILEEAGRMTEEAQNSLLKTLEEPPGNSLLILTCSRREGLLDTIRSRCEEIRLSSPPAEELAQAAGRYFTEIEPEKWEALLLLAGGVPGEAAQLDLDLVEEERAKADALVAAAGKGTLQEYYPLLESWVSDLEERGEDAHLLASRRISLILLLAREKAFSAALAGSAEADASFAGAERMFRTAHRALVGTRPGANLRLLMEEFGVGLWNAAASARGESSA